MSLLSGGALNESSAVLAVGGPTLEIEANLTSPILKIYENYFEMSDSP